jgi:hypothetical protein
MPGNTSDKTTLPDFLCKIQKQYGKMNRLWIMDQTTHFYPRTTKDGLISFLGPDNPCKALPLIMGSI